MSLKDEYMVYTIQVSTISGEPIPQDKLEELKNYLTALYSGKKFPEPEKVKLKTFRKTLPLPQNKVKIDNKTSEKYTIVEVSTHDRLGILYKLTKALIEMNTRLRRAIITTEGNRVIDTFYITDIDYKKITDEEFLRKLKENLLSVISN
jgi:[protein-PII] uridylyltransferase